jgi:phosphate transport system permease protein
MSSTKSANAIYAARKLRSRLFMTGSLFAALFGLAWLAMILGTLVIKGVPGINLDLFTKSIPPPMEVGGLANAIVGSAIMVVIAVVVGTPIGVLAGTYLAEYGRYDKLSVVIRNLNDILLSAPSIVVGLFVYEIVVAAMGHFSGLAGGLALAVIVIPVVVRLTENMLLLIPNSLREAAVALGAPISIVVHKVLWKAAMAGIVTAILLAIARISGETAPLLFTSLGNQFFSTDVTQPMASLPTAIFQLALSPYKDWHQLAWSGALLTTFAVLTLSILARLVASGERK